MTGTDTMGALDRPQRTRRPPKMLVMHMNDDIETYDTTDYVAQDLRSELGSESDNDSVKYSEDEECDEGDEDCLDEGDEDYVPSDDDDEEEDDEEDNEEDNEEENSLSNDCI
jgi:hypothetical protein